MTGRWRYLLMDIPTMSPVAELTDTLSRSFGDTLNSPGSFSLSLPLDLDPALGLNRDNLRAPDAAIMVELDDVPLWAGPVLVAVPNLEAGTLDLAGEGWHNLVRRVSISTDLTWAATEQVNIAAGLIDYTEIPGIDTSLVTPTGVLRDRTYPGHELKSAGEAVEELAQVNDGFDFRYEPRWTAGPNSTLSMAFLTQYPPTGRSTDIELVDGDNCTVRSIEDQGDKLAYIVRAVGAGEGPAAVRATATDAVRLAAHYRLEHTLSMTDVSVLATLQNHANTALRRHALNLTVPTVEVGTEMLGEFRVGDRVQFRMARGVWIEDSDYRIVAFECPNQNVVNLTLSPLGLFT